MPGWSPPTRASPPRSAKATAAAITVASSERIATRKIGPSDSSGSRRRSSTSRIAISIHAPIAIARPIPGRPSGPASATDSVVLTTTARIPAATGVRVSWRA